MGTRRAVVLGGSGFIGSWVARALKDQNLDVTIFGHRPPPALVGMEGMHFVHGDFSDPEALRPVVSSADAVFHCGAYYPVYSVDRKAQERKALADLQTVIDAVMKAGVEKFIFTSSPMALVTEPAALQRSTYHSIKVRLHERVLQMTDRGLPAVIVIPGACFGPDDWKPTTGRVIVEIANRRLRFILEGKMSAVDVRDMAVAQARAMDAGTIGSMYQMAGWNGMYSEFAALVARIAGVPSPSIRVPYDLAKMIATVDEWMEHALDTRTPLLPQVGLDQVHFGTFLDSGLAVKDLGFHPRPLEQTIRDTLEYFLRTGFVKELPRQTRQPAQYA
ncbi:MAG: NAD-dependent epimerase/dehydratase family protein [Ignavibacterium sp.]|jgi:dihydroflavonol-4-reductase